MIDFYTYIHCKPDGTPFYVGKGFARRSHVFNGGRNKHHKNIVAKYGKENIGVFVFLCDSEAQALSDEIQQIAQLRSDGYELVNKTDGGDGTSGFRHSIETRKKQSIAAIGRKHTPDSIAKISVNNKASNPEIRAKMSEAHKGKTLSSEHRMNISISTKGRKGNPLSEESKEKIRLARKYQVITDETKAKLSVAIKAVWASRKANHSAVLRTN